MRRVAKNILASWIGLAVTAAVGFFLTPFILHRLGNVGFGLWILVSAFTGYYGLLDLGLRSAVVRYVARHAARLEWELLESVLSTTFFAYLLLGVLVMFISMIVAWRFTTLFHVPSEYVASARSLMLVIGVGTALAIPLGVFGGVLEGLQQFTWLGMVQVATVLLRAVLILVLLHRGLGVVTLGIISMAMNLAGYLIYAVVSFKVCPHLRVRRRAARLTTLRTLLAFGIVVFWIGIAQQLRFQLNAVVIGSMLSVQAISMFGIGSKLIAYATDAVQALAQVFTPLFSHFHAIEDDKQLRHAFIVGNRYSSFVMFPIASVFLLAGKSIIRVWVGPAYLSSYAVLAILTVSTALYLAQAASTKILYGMARHSALARVLLIEGISNVALSVALAKPMGINGVALGTAIPLACTSVLFLPLHVCRILRVKLLSYVRETFSFPLLVTAPFAITLWKADRTIQPRTYQMLALELLASGAVYLLGMWIYFRYESRRTKEHVEVVASGAA